MLIKIIKKIKRQKTYIPLCSLSPLKVEPTNGK